LLGFNEERLRLLQEGLGGRFLHGVVLHTGDQVVPFGHELWALPLNALWGLGNP